MWPNRYFGQKGSTAVVVFVHVYPYMLWWWTECVLLGFLGCVCIAMFRLTLAWISAFPGVTDRINRELKVNQELNSRHTHPPFIDFRIKVNFLIQSIWGCARYPTGSKETRVPLRHNLNIAPEEMKVPIDLKPPQRFANSFLSHRDLFRWNQGALRQNPTPILAVFHPLQDIAPYESILNNNPKGSEHDGRYPTRSS